MSAPYRPVTIDDSAQLLAMSYRLRYRTFCLERLFLSKEHYPAQMESDAFDEASVHVGVLNAQNELVGTARVVPPNNAGLPLFRHCVLFPHEATLANPANTVVELSRVCIIRDSTRRPTDRSFAQPEERQPVSPPASEDEDGSGSYDISATLLKAMYQATKRLRATHWIIAVEQGLRRRLVRHFRMPFHQAGPEVDYYGPVAPYLLSLAELDDVIRTRKYPVLNGFPIGLEPEYWPTSSAQAGVRSFEARL